jgi:ATPase subunit of ABC transporter with duplicated ATPase domains
MSEIQVSNISKIFSYEYVLQNVSFDVHRGERIGLIGRNGSGKTTLFRLITGRERKSGDIGEIIIRRGATICCLDQIPEYPSGTTPQQILHQPFAQLMELGRRMQEMEARMAANPPHLDELLQEYTPLASEYEASGGYEFEDRIKWVCVGLDIAPELFDQPYDLLSGGEKTRVVLASLLLQNPDVLLLDEPTNHLDMPSVEWLEEYLKRFEGAVLIISHDRYFLDNAVNKILHLQDGSITKYNSNYTNFALGLKNREAQAWNEYSNVKKELRKLQADLRKSIARNAKNHSQFMSIKIRQLSAEIQEKKQQKQQPRDERVMGLQLQASRKSSKTVLRMQGVQKGFDGRSVLKNIDLLITKGEKVAIIGPNGAGKSTLIRLMMEQLFPGTGIQPDAGEVYVGEGIRAGYLDQELEFDDQSRDVLHTLMYEVGIKEGPARTILARFLFYSTDIEKPINILSGGEKTRLKLAILTHRELNTLVLDEPTNHMDIPSRELLEEMLSDFDGAVIFVSHDRYFINRLARRIITVQDGGISIFEGSYGEYQQVHTTQNLQQASSESSDEYRMQRRQSNREKTRLRRLEELEEQIQQQEMELEKVEKQMLEQGSDYVALQALLKEKDALNHSMNTLLQQWEDLAE